VYNAGVAEKVTCGKHFAHEQPSKWKLNGYCLQIKCVWRGIEPMTLQKEKELRAMKHHERYGDWWQGYEYLELSE
jgi:hypothetical protein